MTDASPLLEGTTVDLLLSEPELEARREHIVAFVADTVETAGAEFVVDTTATILADETRLQQLLENFFRNAVEHDATGRRSLTLPTTPSNTARRALPRTTRRTARPA